jgi:hypothetical protein
LQYSLKAEISKKKVFDGTRKIPNFFQKMSQRTKESELGGKVIKRGLPKSWSS